MGNPQIPQLPIGGDADRESAEPAANGILSKVPGDLIGAGARQLPPPCAQEEATPDRHVTLQVPHLGLVRISYELRSYRRGRSRFWHWQAVRADQA